MNLYKIKLDFLQQEQVASFPSFFENILIGTKIYVYNITKIFFFLSWNIICFCFICYVCVCLCVYIYIYINTFFFNLLSLTIIKSMFLVSSEELKSWVSWWSKWIFSVTDKELSYFYLQVNDHFNLRNCNPLSLWSLDCEESFWN